MCACVRTLEQTSSLLSPPPSSSPPAQDAPLVLQAVESLLSATLADLSCQSFTAVEVALRALYLLGEVVSEKVGGAEDV